MRELKIIYFAILLIGLTIVTACDDDKPEPKEEPNPVPIEVQTINEFVYQHMKAYYYWEHLIPEIDYKREPDTFELFEKCVNREEDAWSFITDDYEGLIDMFAGVSKSTGYEFRLYYRDEDNSNDVIGFIEYVEPGSPGDEAGLKRGDLFYKIDDVKINDSNYRDLIGKDSFKLTLGTLNADRSITEHSPSINIATVEWSSDPILYSDVIEFEGHKIGYLVYTSFIYDYNADLELVFADFKAKGIDNLVVDLRYNSGGSVASALLLGSLIAPASSAGDVFLKTSYNPLYTEFLQEEYGDEFNIIRIESNDNNLDLSKLVVLSTYKTASASEMLIYGLEPHMEVVHIGEVTHGKYYGSVTISDTDNHNWALQPIVMRAENKTNSINYTIGLQPDIVKKDFVVAFQGKNLYQLGDPREDFLAKAIENITGVLPQGAVLKSTAQLNVRALNTEASLSHPLRYDMQYDLKK